MAPHDLDHEPEPGPWARRLALLTALCAVPLFVFGGSVTTLGAGMAVEGWLVAEGHFLLFFPVDKWFRDTATFVEHTHRLFGVLVGLCAIATLLASWRSSHARGAKALALVGLLAVCAQGALGGLRVLEASPRLAFLHGALAQAVFALLCVVALVHSAGWRSGAGRLRGLPGGLLLLSVLTPCVVYAQVVAGAWYRHELRPEPGPEAALRLAVHLVGAFVALAFVMSFALALLRQERRLSWARGAAKRLGVLLGVQVLLGLTAWVGFRPGAVAPLEWAISVAHVLMGALLLAASVQASLSVLHARAAQESSARRAMKLEGVH